MKEQMTNKTEHRMHAEAWDYFEKLGYMKHSGLVLHHVDVNMKQRDPKRYHQWRVEDLVPMTKQAHRSLHMKLQAKGQKRTAQHNKNISKGMKTLKAHGKMIQLHIEREETLRFKTMAEAARHIGCSKQLISQCLQDHTSNKTAKGYTVTIVEEK